MARFIRFKDIFPIKGKAKTPGFGISKGFYLTVLASDSVLPPLLTLINPKGVGGAVEGFGVPMQQGSTKEDLAKPLMRGFYGLSCPKQKTLLKLTVISKEEAGFDPGPLLKSPAALLMPDEVRTGIAAAWHLLQFTFESYDPEVYPALDFLHQIVLHTAKSSSGIIADPLAQTYWPVGCFPIEPDPGLPFSTLGLISAKERAHPDGLEVHTLGMQKFNLPEIEVRGVAPSEGEACVAFLLSLSQNVLKGQLLEIGQTVGEGDASFMVIQGGADKRHWDGIPCFSLTPNGSLSPSAILRTWKKEQG